MSNSTVRACLRCHSKKIRCTGFPDCLPCKQAQTLCEAYIRPKRHESLQALREARCRIEWLQDELLKELDVDCTSLPTGTPLHSKSRRRDDHGAIDAQAQSDFSSQPPPSLASIQPRRPAGDTSMSDQEPADRGSTDSGPEILATQDAPDVSLLALNATGELKYLGPSSGTFFALCAAALVQSCVSNRESHWSTTREAATNPATATVPNDQQHLKPDQVQLLLRSYEMWVHPLYPLFELQALQSLVSRCSDSLAEVRPDQDNPRHAMEMTIFYQVMTLGLTSLGNTIKQMRLSHDASVDQISVASFPSTSSLYGISFRFFETCLRRLHPSVEFIQILLLYCIYSSSGPVGPSQWQLAGLAMRMAIEIGLHYDPQRWYKSDQEIQQRRRVFWSAYAIEISLAYNLGRPPSIGHEHSSTKIPTPSSDSSLGALHIKHRQIQGRIVARMYQASSSGDMPWDERQRYIADLQAELDQWRLLIPKGTDQGKSSAYPPSYWDRLYHSTTFVLHRKGPLCPQPSSKSLVQCIRSAGAYIDNMLEILRSSNVPQSWMLVQGILSAGLTMLITARANFKRIATSTKLAFLLVELPAWSRKCSVCLAIMNERWSENLLSKLDSHFEILADETLKTISNGVTSERTGQLQESICAEPNLEVATAANGSLPYTTAQTNLDQLSTNTSNIYDTFESSWDNLEVFRDVLGADMGYMFWDTYGIESISASTQDFNPHEPMGAP